MNADTTPANQNLIQSTIAPWLTVAEGEKAVAFYKAAFGAVETYRLPEPEAGVVVRLSVNGATFWVSSESEPNDTIQKPLGGNSMRLILTVTDPDALFAQALQAGATEVFPVGEDHGWRLGRLVDPFGLHWEIGHEV